MKPGSLQAYETLECMISISDEDKHLILSRQQQLPQSFQSWTPKTVVAPVFKGMIPPASQKFSDIVVSPIGFPSGLNVTHHVL
jgi:hypothetical protein